MYDWAGSNDATRPNVGHNDGRLSNPAIRANVRSHHVFRVKWRESPVREPRMLMASVHYPDAGTDKGPSAQCGDTYDRHRANIHALFNSCFPTRNQAKKANAAVECAPLQGQTVKAFAQIASQQTWEDCAKLCPAQKDPVATAQPPLQPAGYRGQSHDKCAEEQ
jgi:hypothetical protein